MHEILTMQQLGGDTSPKMTEEDEMVAALARKIKQIRCEEY